MKIHCHFSQGFTFVHSWCGVWLKVKAIWWESIQSSIWHIVGADPCKNWMVLLVTLTSNTQQMLSKFQPPQQLQVSPYTWILLPDGHECETTVLVHLKEAWKKNKWSLLTPSICIYCLEFIRLHGLRQHLNSLPVFKHASFWAIAPHSGN